MRLPSRLRWLRKSKAGAAWLEAVPDLVEQATGRWALQIGEPYPNSYVSLVLPASLSDGRDAVLKLQFPHRESEQEAAALAHWNGDGAVRLLEHHRPSRCLLIERCEPGTHLSERSSGEALAVLIALLPRLWKPASSPFVSLSSEAKRWAKQLPRSWSGAGRPFEQRLLEAALDTIEHLSASQGEQVLLHQDLHTDNVLRAAREPWLAIDPKPLAGEREFGIAPIVRAYELGHTREQVIGRLDRLSAELGLDRERARGWAFSQTLAWCFEGDEVLPRHLETARWLLEGS